MTSRIIAIVGALFAFAALTLGAGSASAAPVFIAKGGYHSVTVIAKNDRPYNIMCETWVVEKNAQGDTFTVNAHSTKHTRLSTGRGWKETWLHCGKGSVGGPEVVRRSLGQVYVW